LTIGFGSSVAGAGGLGLDGRVVVLDEVVVIRHSTSIALGSTVTSHAVVNTGSMATPGL
jgi:hypothetical protein